MKLEKWITHNPYNICTVLIPFKVDGVEYPFYDKFNHDTSESMKVGFYSLPATGTQWAFWDSKNLYTDPDYSKEKHNLKFEYRERNSNE